MEKIAEFMALKANEITSVKTMLGCMRVFEYILQDCSFLHVVQWQFNNDFQENTTFPRINYEMFYRDRPAALEFAHKVGCSLLEQYL